MDWRVLRYIPIRRGLEGPHVPNVQVPIGYLVDKGEEELSRYRKFSIPENFDSHSCVSCRTGGFSRCTKSS